jgi:hypothetical protein
MSKVLSISGSPAVRPVSQWKCPLRKTQGSSPGEAAKRWKLMVLPKTPSSL